VGGIPKGRDSSCPFHPVGFKEKIDMARMATRIASGLAAAGIATLMSVTPAQARVIDPEGGGCVGNNCTYTPTPPPAPGTAWLKIALGAAGGVALVGAGAATVSSRNRRQHQQPHPA
jgi:hypothetical protein